jgi:hypothetical protein
MHPFLEKTAINLNLDMISRIYDKERLIMSSRRWGEGGKEAAGKIDVKKYAEYEFDANSPKIGEIIRKNNNHVGLHLRLNEPGRSFGDSDHSSFSRNNIPWAYFTAAMTEDYHQPSDSVEKVSADLMENIIKITYLTAFDLANK